MLDEEECDIDYNMFVELLYLANSCNSDFYCPCAQGTVFVIIFFTIFSTQSSKSSTHTGREKWTEGLRKRRRGGKKGAERETSS